MTIEDRVRRVLTEAVAEEPSLRGAPLERALRRPRRRPVLIGAAALVLVLAAAVGLVAVRGQGGPRPVAPSPTTAPPAPTTTRPSTAVSTAGWKTYTDAGHNLRLRHPPDWVVRERNTEGMATLAPPEHARRALATWPPFAVTVTAGGPYYVGEAPEPGFTQGRLPGGQAYLRFETDPAQMGEVPGMPKPAPNVADRPRAATYSIDWGRDCKGVKPYRCGAHGVSIMVSAGSTLLWDRYLAVAEAIVRSAEPVTPTRPSYGDRRLPACRTGQWRLVWPGEYGFAGPQRFFLSGGVQHLGGPPCHLRARLELRVERDGRLLPLVGNPASRTVEGDLPGDGITRDGGSWVMRGGPLFWSFYWDEWCNKGLGGPTLRLAAPNGQRLRIGDPAPAAEPSPAFRACQDRGRPSRLAPWP
jgi:hypothetical protein